jgi:hypothetical protein
MLYFRCPQSGARKMAKAVKRLRVTPGSELAEILESARAGPILLEKDGELFRLDREEGVEGLWAGYDPAEVSSALRKTAGSWGDLDADETVAALYRAREEGSRPGSRP